MYCIFRMYGNLELERQNHRRGKSRGVLIRYTSGDSGFGCADLGRGDYRRIDRWNSAGMRRSCLLSEELSMTGFFPVFGRGAFETAFEQFVKVVHVLIAYRMDDIYDGHISLA